uniref:Frizzled-2 n=1 Tax=Hofstenia miamia TaxID=442651 RepID=A0A068CMX9_HOFMI|nr:frizzled-2 [Hofstenia miamia]
MDILLLSIVYVCLSVKVGTYGRFWNRLNHNDFQCKNAKLRRFQYCSHMQQYNNFTFFPNQFNEDNVGLIEQGLFYYEPAIRYFYRHENKECYNAFMKYVCTSYLPPCGMVDVQPNEYVHSKLIKPPDPQNSFVESRTIYWRILPCKRLCESVRDFCWMKLPVYENNRPLHAAFDWSRLPIYNCNLLPSNQPCIDDSELYQYIYNLRYQW